MLFEGKILDGRRRYRACLEIGIEPDFVQFVGPGSADDYVMGENFHRRHLTPAQRTQVVLGVHAYAAKTAARLSHSAGAARGAASTNAQRWGQEDTSQDRSFPRGGKSDEPAQVHHLIAEKAGVGKNTAERVIFANQHGDDAIRAGLKDGTLNAREAERQARELEAAKEAEQAVAQVAAEPKPAKGKVAWSIQEWNGLDDTERLEPVTDIDPKVTFNKQNNDSIEWAQWSWNPVTGCLHTLQELRQRYRVLTESDNAEHQFPTLRRELVYHQYPARIRPAIYVEFQHTGWHVVGRKEPRLFQPIQLRLHLAFGHARARR